MQSFNEKKKTVRNLSLSSKLSPVEGNTLNISTAALPSAAETGQKTVRS